jgi:2-desacetyl-2-hydroxyethyl bacteriochlorophyllide A dehydrogenase
MEIRRILVRGFFFNDTATTEIPDRPQPGEILIETEKTFISAGTELANYTALDPTVSTPGSWNSYPWPSGYANVGRVVAIGEKIEGLATGDRVFTFGKHASHHYANLLDPSAIAAQVQENGRGATSDMVVKIPADVSSEDAAAARMAGVAITALRVSTVQAGDWVVVFGLGMVGNLAAQYFTIQGCNVIGVDPMPARRRLAREVGVEHVVGGSTEETRAAILELTAGRGADAAIDAVGDSLVVEQAGQVAAHAGEVIILGSPRERHDGNLTALIRPVHWDFVQFKGALEWQFPRYPIRGQRHSIYSNIRTYLELMACGKLKLGELISHRMRPEEIESAYENLLNDKEHYWGVVLDWT